MRPVVASLILSFAFVPGAFGEGGGSPPPDGGEWMLYRVGWTGIHCFTTPCPWTGLVQLSVDDGLPVHPPAYAGPALPPMEASDADRARMEAAWPDQCLLVEGRLEREIDRETREVRDVLFVVNQVVGPCG